VTLEQALTHAAEGNAILFVGSGFSRTAVHSASLSELDGDDRMPTGAGLAHILCRVCEVEPEYSLQDISNHFIRLYGEQRLRELLVSLFTTKHLGPEHREFAKLPWKRIYTTNYDDVIERAFVEESRAIEAFDYNNLPSELTPSGLACVHLNGFISRANVGNLNQQLRLTWDSFASAGIPDPQWSRQFRHDVASAKAVLFVGYSASDIDVSRVLSDTPNVRQKAVFVCGKSIDPVLESKLTAYGSLMGEDTASVAGMISKIKSDWIPAESHEPTLSIGTEVIPPVAETPPSHDDVLNLLAYGLLKDSHLWQRIAEPQNHGIIFTRSEVENVAESLELSGTAYVIHGQLGTGKSVFLRNAASLFVSRGGRAFWYDEIDQGIEEEIDEIVRRTTGKILFVVDNYVTMRGIVDALGRTPSDKMSILLSARTIPHQASVQTLGDSLPNMSIRELDVSLLGDFEIRWMEDTFDQNALWPKDVEANAHAKRRFLEKTCDRFLPAIILKSLSSPAMSMRVKEMTDVVRGSGRDATRVFTAALVLAAVGYAPTSDTMLDLFQGDYVNDIEFKQNPAVRAFLSLDGNEFRARNAVVAQYVLDKVLSLTEVTDTVAEMIRGCDSLSGHWRYDALYTTLMRVSQLQSIFSTERFGEGTNQLYDRIKSLNRCRQDPQFWLQWSIARMVSGRFEDARQKLENAYKIGGTRYHTEKLDNQKARLALTEAIETDMLLETAMKSFNEASNIVTKQLKTDPSQDYPFRVATLYRDFVAKYISKMNPESAERCFVSALGVHRAIATLTDNRAKMPHPSRCKRAIDETFDFLKPLRG
jgi:tetratricopeptide (TPR) repeat protein